MDISLTNFLNLFAGWMVSLSGLFDFFNTSISDALREYSSFIYADLFAFIIDNLGLGHFTLLEFFFSVGLMFYLVYQLISWFLNLLP